jgi:hypothetical protein
MMSSPASKPLTYPSQGKHIGCAILNADHSVEKHEMVTAGIQAALAASFATTHELGARRLWFTTIVQRCTEALA